VTTTGRTGGDLARDLTDRQALRTLLVAVAPDVVIHAAGFTDVDACERVPQQAFAINRDVTASLVAALPPTAHLVFISTDQVYPDTRGPHAENEVSPVNVYGQSKLAGERAALAHPGGLVLRTNFFGKSRRPGRQSLSDFVIDSLTKRKPVNFFADVLFSPLHLTTLAGLIVEMVDLGLTGVFNAGCREGDSKSNFALAVARHEGLPTDNALVGSSTMLTDRASRPHDLRLDVSRLESCIGRSMPTLEDEIAKL
jgi:dTDP-4-dehydrorhamnose reductase